jgi:diguanylate cyclase (GGDEF)-like protein
MTSPVLRGVMTSRPPRRAAARPMRRSIARIGRRLWPNERGLAELRWAALTLVVMAALMLIGRLLTPPGVFDRAVLVTSVAAVIANSIAWSPLAGSLSRRPETSLVLGPAVVLVAFAAAGAPDPGDLEPPAGIPLVILGLCYAAMTRGFPLALAILAGVATGVVLTHLSMPGRSLSDGHLAGFIMRTSTSALAAVGIAVVLGRLDTERRRGDRMASRRRRRLGDLAGLHRILARFDGSLPLPDVLVRVVHDMRDRFGLQHSSIYLLEEDGSLRMAGQVDYAEPILSIPPGVGVMGRAVRTRATQLVTDVTTDPDYVLADPAVTTDLAVPLIHADQVLGVLNIEGTAQRPLTSRDVTIAEMIGGAIAAEVRLQRDAEKLSRRHDEIAELHRILRRFDGGSPVREVIEGVVDEMSAAYSIPLVSMFLVDRDGCLSLVGMAGYDAQPPSIGMDAGIIGRAARTRATQFVPDVLRDPDYVVGREDVRSEVAVPIVHEDRLLGVVDFEGTDAHPIDRSRVALAETVASTMASAIHAAGLDEERRHRLQAIERVLELSRGLLGDLDRTRMVDAVVAAARDLLGADDVWFAARGADGVFRVERAIGRALEQVGAEIRPGRGLTGAAVADGVPVRRRREHGEAVEYGLAIPIRTDETVSAVLALGRRGPDGPFTDLDAGIADLLAVQIAIALRNAELHARVSEAAVRDPLTGLLNRRYFDEAVETAFATARRAEAPLSLIVLDLDRFSGINNRHGHTVGDAVLVRTARAIRDVVRDGDIVARYGGEEFVVIAPGATREDAVRVAERVRVAVAGASARPFDDLHIPVTISAGVATTIGDEVDARDLFRAADSALLAAKRGGRDRVMSV